MSRTRGTTDNPARYPGADPPSGTLSPITADFGGVVATFDIAGLVDVPGRVPPGDGLQSAAAEMAKGRESSPPDARVGVANQRFHHFSFVRAAYRSDYPESGAAESRVAVRDEAVEPILVVGGAQQVKAIDGIGRDPGMAVAGGAFQYRVDLAFTAAPEGFHEVRADAVVILGQDVPDPVHIAEAAAQEQDGLRGDPRLCRFQEGPKDGKQPALFRDSLEDLQAAEDNAKIGLRGRAAYVQKLVKIEIESGASPITKPGLPDGFFQRAEARIADLPVEFFHIR